MTTPKEVTKLINDCGGEVTEMSDLPDGSGFAVAAFPLPKEHWLYADDGGFEPPPMPMRTGTDHPRYEELRKMVQLAGRYAVRSATSNGEVQDFDPDALVQNLHVGLLGYHTPDGLSGDSWANPCPTPLASQPEDSFDYLHEKAEKFWVEFSALVNATTRDCPPEIVDELKVRIQDKTSVYGVAGDDAA